MALSDKYHHFLRKMPPDEAKGIQPLSAEDEVTAGDWEEEEMACEGIVLDMNGDVTDFTRWSEGLAGSGCKVEIGGWEHSESELVRDEGIQKVGGRAAINENGEGDAIDGTVEAHHLANGGVVDGMKRMRYIHIWEWIIESWRAIMKFLIVNRGWGSG